MSIHLGKINQDNVRTLLLKALAKEEANVASADKEVKRCLETSNAHKKVLSQLRDALQALGIDVDEYEHK
jgi:hypothetical protein